MEECHICNLEIDEENLLDLECCKHKIHKECFDKCLNLNKMCPFCRKQYLRSTVDNPNEHLVLIPTIPQPQRRQEEEKSSIRLYCCCFILTSMILGCFGGMFYVFVIQWII